MGYINLDKIKVSVDFSLQYQVFLLFFFRMFSILTLYLYYVRKYLESPSERTREAKIRVKVYAVLHLEGKIIISLIIQSIYLIILYNVQSFRRIGSQYKVTLFYFGV